MEQNQVVTVVLEQSEHRLLLLGWFNDRNKPATDMWSAVVLEFGPPQRVTIERPTGLDGYGYENEKLIVK